MHRHRYTIVRAVVRAEIDVYAELNFFKLKIM